MKFRMRTRGSEVMISDYCDSFWDSFERKLLRIDFGQTSCVQFM